ncbi:MAG: hypothetical protein HY829_09625 [Actinobacteria bacterium]|nr:hypothetical protein [Actinomycetota bacterium]
MDARVEHYGEILEVDELDSQTVLVVAGASLEEVRAVVLADAALPTDGQTLPDDEVSAYGFVEVEGGVLALEHTGYADPSVDALVQLSSGGRKAAVVRDNIQAHVRFGAARDGGLVFDDDEYIFLGADERTRVPDELRPLFDLAWIDVDADDQDDDVDPVAVALAMAELVTGIVLTADDFTRLAELPRSEWHWVRTMSYVGGLTGQG